MKNKNTSTKLLALLLASTSGALIAEEALAPRGDILSGKDRMPLNQGEPGDEGADKGEQIPPEQEGTSTQAPPGDISTQEPTTGTGIDTGTQKPPAEQVNISKTGETGQATTPSTGTVVVEKAGGPVTSQNLLQAFAARLEAFFEKFGFTRTGETGTVEVPDLTESQKAEIRAELADLSTQFDSLAKPTGQNTYSALYNDLQDVVSQVSKKAEGVDITTLREEVIASPVVEEAPEELAANTANLLSPTQHIANAYDAYKWVGDELSAIKDTEEPATRAAKTQIDIVSQDLNEILTKSITNFNPKDTAAIKDTTSKLVAASRNLLTLQDRAAGIPHDYTKVTDPDALKAQFQMAYQNLTTTRAFVAQLPDSLKATPNSIGSQLLSVAERGMTRATNLLKQSTTPIAITQV